LSDVRTLGIRLTEVRIDKHTVMGKDSIMECKYDLQGESLYSIKWYKDGLEFYRFVPLDKPQTHLFPQPGIHVDVSISIIFLYQ
jgi:hypothetical protein